MPDDCTSGNPPPCRHCGGPSYRRKMCRDCFLDLDIRALYPASNKNGNRQEGKDTFADTPLPDEPTGATPGSDAKILVLQARLKARVALKHPDDNDTQIARTPDQMLRQRHQARLANKYGDDLDD